MEATINPACSLRTRSPRASAAGTLPPIPGRARRLPRPCAGFVLTERTVRPLGTVEKCTHRTPQGCSAALEHAGVAWYVQITDVHGASSWPGPVIIERMRRIRRYHTESPHNTPRESLDAGRKSLILSLHLRRKLVGAGHSIVLRPSIYS